MTKPKAPKPPKKADDPEQSKRFIEAAQAGETDPDPKAFDRAFDKLAKPGKPNGGS
ncbi:MAG TPA: hypothetical protein VGL66_11430 [Caulobacteraceae bacterium]|jgi:hypothetical protein